MFVSSALVVASSLVLSGRFFLAAETPKQSALVDRSVNTNVPIVSGSNAAETKITVSPDQAISPLEKRVERNLAVSLAALGISHARYPLPAVTVVRLARLTDKPERIRWTPPIDPCSFHV